MVESRVLDVGSGVGLPGAGAWMGCPVSLRFDSQGRCARGARGSCSSSSEGFGGLTLGGESIGMMGVSLFPLMFLPFVHVF